MTIREREDVRGAMLHAGLPLDCASGIERYMFDRCEPGSFVYAVLCNDLVGAAGAADHINQLILFQWASFVYNSMPTHIVGSHEKVSAWLKGGEGAL